MTAREKLDLRAAELKLDGTGLSNTKLAKLIKDTETEQAAASNTSAATNVQTATTANDASAAARSVNAATKAQAAAEAQSAAAETITVVGPKKGRWRAGRHFTLEPTVIPMSDLTEAQFDAIDSDPLLVVSPSQTA